MQPSISAAVLGMVLLGLPLEASGADGTPVAGRLVAETTQSVENIREIAVRTSDKDETSRQLKALFHEVLEAYGYRVDPLSGTVLTFQWNGPFGQSAPRSPMQIVGEGGNRTAPKLGFNLTLAMPRTRSGDQVYTLGCSLSGDQGELWKAKAVAKSSSADTGEVARVLVGQLVHHLGRAVRDTAFRGRPADAPTRRTN